MSCKLRRRSGVNTRIRLRVDLLRTSVSKTAGNDIRQLLSIQRAMYTKLPTTASSAIARPNTQLLDNKTNAAA